MEFDYSYGYDEPIGPGLGWDSGGYGLGADYSSGYPEPIGPGLGWDAGGYPTGSSGTLPTTWEQYNAGNYANTQYAPFTAPPAPNLTGGGFLNTILGGLGSVGSFLGSNASWLGPLASAAGGLGAGAIGSQASSDAARLQAEALNRGLDLQTAQWLQQQANQAPWLQAGQQALGQMSGLTGQPQPTLGQLAPLSGAGYGLPSATPGWNVQGYQWASAAPQAADYRYTPGQGPQAADYRYAPGQIPAASQYRYTPGAVPTLQGAEMLANDPGYQFRQDEARRALEASALARGSGMSGATLGALQRQSQDLASQEYGQAWNRAAQQAQMREGWAQQASQMGFGQAMSEAQLREQVNQIASQQGWSQAQAEAAFREQLAQQAGAQNWTQALQGNQNIFNQQLQAQQYNQQQQSAWANQQYQQQLQQNQLLYGRDWQQREAENQRLLDAYNAQRQGQTQAWNQYASLAGLGQTAVGQLGSQGQANATQMASLLSQLGNAQAGGQLGSGQSWMSALGNVGNAVQGGLANNALLSALQGLNR